MKILLVNNFYYNRGGDCTYLFSLKNLLEKEGHKTIIFSMNHPQNFESEFNDYFVSYINYDDEVKDINLSSALKVFKRTIYSGEAKNKIESLIVNEKPDVVHLQNIHHHITPSIFYTLKKYNIPIVWTLHDYTLVCPNTSFLAHGEICEKCKKSKYFWPLLTKCKKSSYSASTMAAFETIMHKLSMVNDLVDAFVAPSEFLRNKFIEYGFDERKLIYLPHFVEFDIDSRESVAGDYYLYVGRISEEKGIRTLIDATLRISANNQSSEELNGVKLKIVGGGPLLDEMKSYVGLQDNKDSIEFLGYKSHEEVIELIKGSRFVVLPSEWYENYPFAIIETFACGKPAIGSKIGGIPELIKDTERGLIFKTGDPDDLGAAIRYLLNNPDLVKEMGHNAKAFVENELNSDRHYEQIMEIYDKVISEHNVVHL